MIDALCAAYEACEHSVRKLWTVMGSVRSVGISTSLLTLHVPPSNPNPTNTGGREETDDLGIICRYVPFCCSQNSSSFHAAI